MTKIAHPNHSEQGSVFIVVLSLTLALIAIAICFAHSMRFEYAGTANAIAAKQAQQTINGASKYIKHVLENLESKTNMPDELEYVYENVKIGNGIFWIIGRDYNNTNSQITFGITDESAKLNLNTATRTMLEELPNMTPQLAAAIIDWRDTNNETTPDGAESNTYLRNQPQYKCKNAPFESIAELRLVQGADLETLIGNDHNLNGIIEPQETDNKTNININNNLDDFGLWEYLTIYSNQPNKQPNGKQKFNINDKNIHELITFLNKKLGQNTTKKLVANTNLGKNKFSSILEFYSKSKLSREQFEQIYQHITTSTKKNIPGLININTASPIVLACIPGISQTTAAEMIDYRTANPDNLKSVAWAKEILDKSTIQTAGKYLTTQTYQYSADIVAINKQHKGYTRNFFVYDCSSGKAKIIFHSNRTKLGWALPTEFIKKQQERQP